jgi:large subunit ribosomal protein L6
VTEGFSQQMDIVGVGYKADVQGARSFSRSAIRIRSSFLCRKASTQRRTSDDEGKHSAVSNDLTVSGIDKQKLGQVCAEMHKLRKPTRTKARACATRTCRLS